MFFLWILKKDFLFFSKIYSIFIAKLIQMLSEMDCNSKCLVVLIITPILSNRHLSLSTNNIEKIANLNGLKNLKILSLGRNKIKTLTGLRFNWCNHQTFSGAYGVVATNDHVYSNSMWQKQYGYINHHYVFESKLSTDLCKHSILGAISHCLLSIFLPTTQE